MYKLIIVDDEVEIRSGLALYFPWQTLGFTVVGVFENGQAALSYLEMQPADVMLCDIYMPGMTGLDLVKELRSRNFNLTILLLSGHRDFEYARQAFSYNVKGYIVKPASYDELYATFSGIKLELDKQRNDETAEVLSPQEATHQDKVILTIKRYVERHYREASLDNAARIVNMNPDYVSKYFRQHTGQYFSDYVVEVRMQRAAELLHDIQYKTYEISELVGYSYPKNFTRTFKKHFGVSPREYRNGSAAQENN